MTVSLHGEKGEDDECCMTSWRKAGTDPNPTTRLQAHCVGHGALSHKYHPALGANEQSLQTESVFLL